MGEAMDSKGHRKIFVGHMLKYAVFDIKQTQNHSILILEILGAWGADL